MAFAIIKTGGKQYRVTQGDKIEVEKLDGDVGANITFGSVLFYGTDSGVLPRLVSGTRRCDR